MKYDLVLFDLDGTMLDTGNGICECAWSVLDELGMPRPDREQMRRFVGPPLEITFPTVAGTDPETTVKAAAMYRQRYDEYAERGCVPYDGILDALHFVHSVSAKTGTATLKKEFHARRMLKHYHLAEHLDFIAGVDDAGERATKELVVAHAMRGLGVSDPGKVVLIGDTEYDARGAMAAGIDFIGVTYGYGFASKEEIAAFPHVYAADTVAEVIAYLKK
ncbi:HAD hydrolase-like protein [Zongyangia hominis]|uniref:HAD hydrolase-like protein n=1 Tax=Zongyangia hominis TaxID=2763677 RepID=A0A926E7V7_9FIRM|nr:HAD hydrolase-like protein [Zongyangia hominis]MBC8569480.1 HAD hydrolase-like protein [Zongyangia hominis]